MLSQLYHLSLVSYFGASKVQKGTQIIMDIIRADITCSICLELLHIPTATPCLHRFCETCICDSLRQNGYNCPLCREKITTKRSLRMDSVLSTIVSKPSSHWDLKCKICSEHIREAITSIECMHSCMYCISIKKKQQQQQQQQRLFIFLDCRTCIHQHVQVNGNFSCPECEIYLPPSTIDAKLRPDSILRKIALKLQPNGANREKLILISAEFDGETKFIQISSGASILHVKKYIESKFHLQNVRTCQEIAVMDEL